MHSIFYLSITALEFFSVLRLGRVCDRDRLDDFGMEEFRTLYVLPTLRSPVLPRDLVGEEDTDEEEP